MKTLYKFFNHRECLTYKADNEADEQVLLGKGFAPTLDEAKQLFIQHLNKSIQENTEAHQNYVRGVQQQIQTVQNY